MILRRIRETTDAVLAAKPDVLVIIDSPDFTHRVARRVRARDPSIPIVDYVSPTVWAWRPGRARAMRPYVDQCWRCCRSSRRRIERLGGPPCIYVGHPLTRAARPAAAQRGRAAAARARSRRCCWCCRAAARSEIRHHMAAFGETLAPPARRGRRLRSRCCRRCRTLPRPIRGRRCVLAGAAAHRRRRRREARRFRIARAALAKSGTVTLELALAGVPMVDRLSRHGAGRRSSPRGVIRVSSVILANLVLGENVVPEFLQEDCTAEKLAPALARPYAGWRVRQQQLDAFARLDRIMSTGERRRASAPPTTSSRRCERGALAMQRRSHRDLSLRPDAVLIRWSLHAACPLRRTCASIVHESSQTKRPVRAPAV